MTGAESNTKPRAGRPKDSVKRLAILEVAIGLFLKRDFMDVTMDAIAAEANVSKLTVYSHFGDKEVLFSEAVRHHQMTHIPPALLDFPDTVPLRKIIEMMTAKYFDTLNTEKNVMGFQLLMRPRVQSAGIPQMVWRDGPARMIPSLALLFEHRAQKGEMSPQEDYASAASLLLTLSRGQLFYELILGIREEVSAEERSAHLEQVVRVFCTTYAIK